MSNIRRGGFERSSQIHVFQEFVIPDVIAKAWTVLGKLLRISELRFNPNDSFESLCFKQLGFLLYFCEAFSEMEKALNVSDFWFMHFIHIACLLCPFHEKDDLTFEKFEKIDFSRQDI